MVILITIIHIIVCIFLVSIVLLQHGKGADIGATFGGSSQSLFGTEGPVPMLNKVTTFSAIIFMVTSISLAYISAHRTTGSVMQDVIETPPPIQQALPEAEPIPETVPMPTGETEEVPFQEGAPAATPDLPLAEEAMEPAALAPAEEAGPDDAAPRPAE